MFQPTSVDDALGLVGRYGADAWLLAGGLDSFDWLKDRIKRLAESMKMTVDELYAKLAAKGISKETFVAYVKANS